MSEPLFTIDRRFIWSYADDRLSITDVTNATLVINGELAGRIADGLQAMETAGLYMQPILSAAWHIAAAGSAGLICPEDPSSPPSGLRRAGGV